MSESIVNYPAAGYFFQNKTLKQLFSCECCEIFRNINFTNFTEQLRTTASVFMERICNIKKPNVNKRTVAVQGSVAGRNHVGSYYAGPKWRYIL